MNLRIKDSFLVLLRMGLWEKMPSALPHFPLSAAEWSLIFDMAKGQTVEGLIYEGIMLLPKAYFPPQEILLKWTVRVDAIERYNKKVRNTLAVLAAGFSKHAIDFVLLKGLGLAENYAKPILRVSGDIDLFFYDKASYNKANDLLKAKGIKLHKGDHHSIFYTFHQIEVEHHTQMVDIFNPFCQKYISDFIAREKQNVQTINVENNQLNIPSTLTQLVQANAHILKHYMGFGVGLRQFCDVARLYHVYGMGIDGQQLKEVYAKLGMRKWMNLMHNFLIDQLGLETSKLPYVIDRKINTDNFLSDILISGNFGFHDTRFVSEGHANKINYKRDYIHKRVLPHLMKLLKITPNEVFWYPVSKVYTKLTGR